MHRPHTAVKRAALQDLLHIAYWSHEIRLFGFLYFALIKKKCKGFTGVDMALYGIYHGIVGADKVPKSLAGLLRKVDHFAYVEYVILDPIEQISLRNTLVVVVYCGNTFVFVFPAPEFHPFEIVPYQCAVRVSCETVVHFLYHRVANRRS